MNAILLVACLAISADDKPAPKKDSTDAALDLLQACIAGGGLRAVRDEKTNKVIHDKELGIPLLEVTDCAKLRKSVAAKRNDLPMLRNALIGLAKLAEPRGAPALVFVLRAVAEELDDWVIRRIAFQLLAEADAPRPTSRGLEAIRLLANAGIKDGSLAFQPDRPTGGRLVVVNSTRLRALLVDRRAAITEEALDAAVALSRDKNIDHSALLRVAGEVAGDRRAVAYASLLAGRSRQREGYAEALRLLRDAAARFDALHDVPNKAQAQWSLGRLFQDVQQLDRAIAAFRQARRLFESAHGRKHRHVGLMLYNLATVYVRRQETQSALFHLVQAQPILMEKGSPRDAAACIALMGDVNWIMRYPEEARDNFLMALTLYQKDEEPDDDVADCHASLGHAYLDLKEYNRARYHFDQALGMRTDLHGINDVRVGKALLDLASAARLNREFGLATYSTRQASGLFRQKYGPRDPRLSVALGLTASIYRSQGKSEAALAFCDHALNALVVEGRQSVPAEKRDVADFRPVDNLLLVLADKADLLETIAARQKEPKAKAARLREALRAYVLAGAGLERIREGVTGYDDRVQMVARSHFTFGRQIGIRRQLHDLDADATHLHAAFEAAEQGTARTLLDQLGGGVAQTLAGVSPELRAQRVQALARLQATDKAHGAAAGRESSDRVLALWAARMKSEGELNAIDKRIDKEAPQFASLRRPRPCSLAEARAAMHDNEVALLYLLGSPRSYVVLIEARPAKGDASEGLAVVELPSEKEIVAKVLPLIDEDVLLTPARVRTLGKRAFDLLLLPLAKRLAGKNLLIVPSGSLSYVPFELLQEPTGDEGERRYLIEGRRVRYAPSLTALHVLRQWQKKRAASGGKLWALADPIYEDKDPRFRGKPAARPAGPFARLPQSAAEVRSIAKLLDAPEDAVLVGDKATEANVRKASTSGELAKARYVHFATHGVLGVGMGRLPGLVLGHVGRDAEPGGDDGYLDAEEVLTLRLNADLVVLSACRSYDGAMHNGEGVRGLARAFLCAGSKGVLCSLWSVEDRSTAEFMAEFYRRLKGGATATEALCQTKRALIDRGKLPRDWAAFVLVGE